MASNKVAESYVMMKQNYELFFHIEYWIFMNHDKLFEPFNHMFYFSMMYAIMHLHYDIFLPQ